MPSVVAEAKATSDLITLIVTTSPTPSAPSTDLLSTVFRSLEPNCPALLDCPVIVVFDSYDHVVSRARLKKGQVTAEGAKAYEEYKENVKALVRRTFGIRSDAPFVTTEASAEFGSPKTIPVPLAVSSSPDGRLRFIECTERLGFGLAVRSALRIATTPFVWVHQHDWKLDCAIPLREILEEMMRASQREEDAEEAEAPIEYVCLPSPRMLNYSTSMDVEMFPRLKALTAKLERREGVPLTPLYFWHDKPHICRREHYLARVFPSRLAISRGMFIEDSIGHRARDQMKEGIWAKWATWLYVPGDGAQSMSGSALSGVHDELTLDRLTNVRNPFM
ncbi:alcohol dehydrogenase [Plectosphaerella cucumerina]|uniref:Alcohol dehydrogenase n=1 Tax=Plectosphaerella cucumerina TaxID=40658 RepID=A0A8K0TIP5_9PEZI|nr:alcohol dehydrogenase [Plectosphaerella cucumerina]